MTKLIVNVTTGEEIERALNKAEKDQQAIDEAAEMIVKYGIELGDEQLENEIIARLTTKEERTEPGKKETYQLLREGEMLRDKYEEEDWE